MSAATSTWPGAAAKTRRKPVSGWGHLSRLLPYFRGHGGEIILGLLAQAVMGITGTLLPLLVGAVVDCIKGAEAPLVQLGRLTRLSLGFLLPYYHPRSAQTIEIFCTALILICVFQGLFSYCTRQILIGLSRDIEYDLRNDLLRRINVALHERPKFCPHGPGARHHVQR